MATLTITPSVGQAFTFGHLEIPSAINFGGKQMEYTHKLPGGVRVVNATGFDYDDIEWRGYFDGITSVDRARYLETLAVAGNPIICTYDRFKYSALIKEFRCNFQYLPLPYTISLRVIADLTTPITLLAPLGFDDAILGDLYELLILAELVQFGGIAGAIAALAVTLEALASITGSGDAEIAAITAKVDSITSAAASAANALSAKLFGNTSAISSFLGAPVRTNLPSTLSLDVQSNDFDQIVTLYQIQYLTIRMSKNLSLINSATNSQKVTLINANLYGLAAEYYNDATLWTLIRDANNLNDFIATGLQTLLIPPNPSTTQ